MLSRWFASASAFGIKMDCSLKTGITIDSGSSPAAGVSDDNFVSISALTIQSAAVNPKRTKPAAATRSRGSPDTSSTLSANQLQGSLEHCNRIRAPLCRYYTNSNELRRCGELRDEPGHRIRKPS